MQLNQYHLINQIFFYAMKDKLKHEILGEIAILLSAVFLGIVAILAKETSRYFSGIFLSFCQFFTGLILSIALIALTGKSFKIHNKKIWVIRGILGVVTISLFYVAIKISSSGRVSLLSNIFPIFVFISGFLFFKEKITLSGVLSLVLCLTGVMFVMYDGSKYKLIGDILAVLSSISAAVAIHFVKKLRETDSSIMVYLAVCCFGLLLLPFSIHDVPNITPFTLLLIIIMGILIFGAQVLTSYGIKYLSATKASVTSYFRIPFTIVLSYFILREQMTPRFYIGIGFIIAGLLIDSVLLTFLKKNKQPKV